MAHFKLGSVLLSRGQAAEAIAELRQACQLKPESPEILLALGKALLAAGDAREAADALERLLHLSPDSEEAKAAHLQLAQAYRKLGRPVEAAQQIELFRESRQADKN